MFFISAKILHNVMVASCKLESCDFYKHPNIHISKGTGTQLNMKKTTSYINTNTKTIMKLGCFYSFWCTLIVSITKLNKHFVIFQPQ